MSGTSLDGVDGVLAEFDDLTLRPVGVRAHAHRGFAPDQAAELLALNTSGDDELHRAALAANRLMQTYADVVTQLLALADCRPDAVAAIGAHGQTVRHRPQAFSGPGYTVQLVNGALLAELTGISTVCDFRSADLAAGGQGAPLVPAFHAACLGNAGQDAAVLNVGGIANLTLLPALGPVGGFDTGPGNLLMDLWCRRTQGQPYDASGAIAASGQVDSELLQRMMAEPFFAAAPPKSTGRDQFHAAWLDHHLATLSTLSHGPADVMATLAELTARTTADALQRHLPSVRRLLVCGGGAFNDHLMRRWRALLPTIDVDTTQTIGIPADQVEALAFAWLAACRLQGRPASLPGVTGAWAARVLGAVYAAPLP